MLEWLKVQDKLAELSGKRRDLIQIKGFWRRLKLNAKSNLSEHKKKLKITGGGNNAPPSPSNEDQIIMDLCPIDFIIDNNEFDSDGQLMKIDIITEVEIISMPTVKKDEGSKLQDIKVNKNIDGETDIVPFLMEEEVVNEKDVYNNEVPISKTNVKVPPEATKKITTKLCTSHVQKPRRSKPETSLKTTIVKSNIDFKKRTVQLLEAEYALKMEYQKRELSHQELRHKLEIDILMLQKEKLKTEIENLKNV